MHCHFHANMNTFLLTDVDLCSKYCFTDKSFPWVTCTSCAVTSSHAVYFAMSYRHAQSHTSQHSICIYHTSHGTPNPSTAPSLSLFRVKRDWESGRIPVHRDTHAQLLCIWWRECPCVLPVTTWDGTCPSISPSCLVWNSVELHFHKLYAIWYIKEMFWLCTHDVIIITFHTCMPIHHIISYYENLTVKNV